MAADKRTPAQIRKAEIAYRRARFAQSLSDPDVRAIFSSVFKPLQPLLESEPTLADANVLAFVGKGVEYMQSEGEQPA